MKESPGSSAQLLWHAAAWSLMRAASRDEALGRGGEGGEHEEECGELLLFGSSTSPSGLVVTAEVEVEAAAAASTFSSPSSAFVTESGLKRPLARKDAGARLDIWFF